MSEQLSVAEIQKEAERLLGIFDEFCRAHDLSYFIAYGTLLGAVRHQGPIPWDDDVDVLMPRPDYDRFVELYRAQPVAGTKVFKEGDPEYPLGFAKLTSLRTKMVEDSVHFPDDYGVFIDVFPLDGLPRRGQKRHLRYVDVVHRVFQAAYHQKVPTLHKLRPRDRLRQPIGVVARVISRERYLRMIDRAMRKYPYESAEQVAMLLSFMPLETEIFQKAELEGEARLPYGSLALRAFANSEAVLERNYGPTWRTPIKRERASHGVATWREPQDSRG